MSNDTGTTHYDSLQASYSADQKDSHNEVIITSLQGQLSGPMMVSTGSLRLCDAMFFSVGSQFLGVNSFLELVFFYIYFFTSFCVYTMTPKLFSVFEWTFIGL